MIIENTIFLRFFRKCKICNLLNVWDKKLTSNYSKPIFLSFLLILGIKSRSLLRTWLHVWTRWSSTLWTSLCKSYWLTILLLLPLSFHSTFHNMVTNCGNHITFILRFIFLRYSGDSTTPIFLMVWAVLAILFLLNNSIIVDRHRSFTLDTLSPHSTIFSFIAINNNIYWLILISISFINQFLTLNLFLFTILTQISLIVWTIVKKLRGLDLIPISFLAYFRSLNFAQKCH